jgi:H+/Cl- antiporter ClcA
MVVVVAGTSVAAGLFVPMMLVGAVIGRICGSTLKHIFPGSLY